MALRESDEDVDVGKVRELFQLSLPELRPTSVSHFMKLVRDRRLVEFRNRIRLAAQHGEVLDAAFACAALVAANDAKVRFERAKTVTTWVGRGLSLIPGASVAVILGEEVAGQLLARKRLKEYEWLYCLLDAHDNANAEG
jgi:hypothetical protein